MQMLTTMQRVRGLVQRGFCELLAYLKIQSRLSGGGV